MSDLYSVRDITDRLSTMIPGRSEFQDVCVHGEVEVQTSDPRRVFWLRDAAADEKIRCFISRGRTAAFAPSPANGSTVAVKGSITLYPSFSQYQIIVSDMQPLGVNTSGNGSSSTVSQMTGTLSDIIERQFREVHIQGRISSLTQNSSGVFWHLHDVDRPTTRNAPQINCVPFDAPDLINGKIQLRDGNLIGNEDNVRVEGYIRLCPAMSQYQIRVTQVFQPDDGTALCRCRGCSQCSQQGCGRPRENPQYGSCPICLPRPLNELYELCLQCYEVSPDHERKVEKAVYGYLSEINIHGFSPRNQYEIQLGSRNGIPDVVLVKGDDGTLAVIAECKGAGYVGHGIEQLQSYLSATDTRFGIFANRCNLRLWKFYENRRHNVFEPITRSQFEEGVHAEIALLPRFEHEIKALESQKASLEVDVEEMLHEKQILNDKITEMKTHSPRLEGEIRALESQKASLEVDIAGMRQEKLSLESKIAELKTQSEQKKKKGLINWLKNLFSKENS